MVEIHLTQWPFIRFKRESYSEKAVGGFALAIAILAGSTFAGFAKSLRSSLSALSLLFVSEVLTGFFVLFSFGVVPVARHILQTPRKHLKWLGLMAVCSGIGGPLCWFTGLSFTTAINAGFFARSEMIFSIIFAHMILKEKVTSAHLAAIVSILAGIVVISLSGFTQELSFKAGDLFIVLAMFFYASGNMIFRSKLHNVVEPHIALFCRSLTAISIFFLVSPFLAHPFISEIYNLPMALIPVLIGFAFVSRFLNSVSFYIAIDRLPVTTVSLVSSLDVIGSTVFAFLYLGEAIEWYHFVGGAFVILGTLLLEFLGTHPSDKHLETHLKQRLP